MIRKNAIAFVMMLAVSSAGMAFAGDIYKWTDEDGNVHYGDHPASEASKEREASQEPLAIGSWLTDTSKTQVRYQAKAPVGPTPEELRAQVLEREEKCATYKARLQRFLTSRRLYRKDENGKSVYLDEDEIFAERERVQNQVLDYCNL